MKQEQAAAKPGGPINILVVDDSATMRAVIKRVVSLTEVPVGTIHEAANGRAALKILETSPVDAVFTDINMPVMSGDELLREIAKQPRWNKILRVVISTDGSKLRRKEAQELNVSLYIEKPFRPEVVRDVLVEIARPVS